MMDAHAHVKSRASSRDEGMDAQAALLLRVSPSLLAGQTGTF